MAGPTILEKRYLNHFGLDLKSSDLTRSEQYSSGMLNAQYRKSGSIEKRKGFEAHGASQGGHGTFTYNRVTPLTGVEAPEVIAISNAPYRMTEVNLNVTYSGGDPTALISIFYDTVTSQYRCQILEGATVVLDQALGLGFDESSPYTVASLASAITALTGFSTTVTGTGTIPAAFLKTVRDYDLSSSGGALDVVAQEWVAINTTVSTPFSGSETNKNSLNFENVTSVQINNIIYFSNGYDEVQKYDGQTLYRAGLPNPASVATALVGSGSVTGSNYTHVVSYVQKDASGNIHEGNFLASANQASVSSEDFDVTIANVLAGTGFNTNGAIVAGAQSTVNTIDVDDGSGGTHTLQVGDTAYFFDSVTGDYVEREVTGITSSTITVAGAAVTVADNAVISNNLRIAIYRNKTSGTAPVVGSTSFFLVAEIPNDSFNSTQVFSDDTVDANLGAEFIVPLTDRSTPPKGKYVSSFRNQMVLTGNMENPNTVYYSDVDGPEFFPLGVNEFNIETISGEINTGIAPNNEVFAVFKEQSIHIVSGDIANQNFRVDQLTSDIGCVAHATIKEVRGSLYFLSDRGPYTMTGGQIPTPLGGNRIEPVFDQAGLTDDETLQLKRAIAINDRKEEKYILFLPAESVTSGDRHANAFSRTFAFDYSRDAFLEWNNMDFSGGVTIQGDELYFVERRYSTFNGSVDHILYRRHNNDDAYDYQDNNEPVSFNYKSHWEALGEPSVLKRYLRIRVFSNEELRNNSLSLTVKTEINFIPDSTHTELTLGFDSGGYGVSEYGSAPYGDPAEPTLKSKLRPGRIRSHRVIFENNNAQENVILTGWELEIAAPFRPAFKR